MRPPSLLVKLWKLNALGQPDCYVIVKRTTLLQFCHPDVTKRNATSLAPLTNSLQAPRYVTRLPVDSGPVSECAEPDVFANAFRASKLVQVSTGPDDASQTGDTSLLYDRAVKANV